MNKRARGARLWYFRTPDRGLYGLSEFYVGRDYGRTIDDTGKIEGVICFGSTEPTGLPHLQPGACIPVAVSEEKGHKP